MRLRPSDAFFAAELSEDKPGVMDEKVALLQPSVGIVTIVGFDHSSTFVFARSDRRRNGQADRRAPGHRHRRAECR